MTPVHAQLASDRADRDRIPRAIGAGRMALIWPGGLARALEAPDPFATSLRREHLGDPARNEGAFQELPRRAGVPGRGEAAR